MRLFLNVKESFVYSSLNKTNSPKFAYDQGESRKLDMFFTKNHGSLNKNEGMGQMPRVQNTKERAVLDKAPRNADQSLEKERASQNTYAKRVQMDKFLARPEFRIKSRWQVLQSMVSFFTVPPDKVCKFFVTKRFPEICDTLEQMVTAVRIIFPRSDHSKNAKLRQSSPFSYKVLDVIRRWDISHIASKVGFLQNRSRSIYVSDLEHLVRMIYRPIFILDAVDTDTHFPFVLNKLYQYFAKDNGAHSSNEREQTIARITYLYEKVSREICYILYPLLMKMVCKTWCDYSTFLVEHRQKIYQFLNLNEENCITPQIDDAEEDENEEPDIETMSASEVEKQNLKKTVQSGLETLEILFPGSGWYQPESFPDFYQYFVSVFDFKKGMDCIHPQNPILQIYILTQILQDLFYGWRGMISMSNSNDNSSPLGKLIFDWREGFEKLIYRNYLKLLQEYYDHFSLTAEFRSQTYGQKVTDEIKRLTRNSILPFYSYSVSGNISLRQTESDNLFTKIDTLYHELDKIATKPDKVAYINNCSAPFVFDIPTPVSKRLFSLFDTENRSNEILITMTYEITAVLHYLVNCPDSWAYSTDDKKKIFRSHTSANIIPVELQDQGSTPDDVFRCSIERLRARAMEKFKKTPQTEVSGESFEG
jgi:hypothetical protein